MAKTISVVTIVGEKPLGVGDLEAGLSRHLSRHRLNFSFSQVESKGRPIGDALASVAAERESDLLVMGAFGHSRIRDFVLGGATKSMLARPPLPLFLSH
jgi:nucleotide-binding universal stress UspA family protein